MKNESNFSIKGTCHLVIPVSVPKAEAQFHRATEAPKTS